MNRVKQKKHLARCFFW